jgi:hypothetical protein
VTHFDTICLQEEDGSVPIIRSDLLDIIQRNNPTLRDFSIYGCSAITSCDLSRFLSKMITLHALNITSFNFISSECLLCVLSALPHSLMSLTLSTHLVFADMLISILREKTHIKRVCLIDYDSYDLNEIVEFCKTEGVVFSTDFGVLSSSAECIFKSKSRL